MEKQLHTGELFRIATQEELLDLFGSEEEIVWKKGYLSADSEQAELAAIWSWRGDTVKSEYHLTRIKDEGMRLCTQLALYELIQ